MSYSATILLLFSLFFSVIFTDVGQSFQHVGILTDKNDISGICLGKCKYDKCRGQWVGHIESNNL